MDFGGRQWTLGVDSEKISRRSRRHWRIRVGRLEGDGQGGGCEIQMLEVVIQLVMASSRVYDYGSGWLRLGWKER